jgi:hypothetical protein
MIYYHFFLVEYDSDSDEDEDKQEIIIQENMDFSQEGTSH